MKKKVLALVLAASMAASMATSVSVFAEAATATVADLPAEAQFEPNADYDEYTVVEYTIEDIQADLVCTVSTNKDHTEFYLECNFYGDDQMTKTKYDGKEYTVEEDKTGFMKVIHRQSLTKLLSRTSGFRLVMQQHLMMQKLTTQRLMTLKKSKA